MSRLETLIATKTKLVASIAHKYYSMLDDNDRESFDYILNLVNICLYSPEVDSHIYHLSQELLAFNEMNNLPYRIKICVRVDLNTLYNNLSNLIRSKD